MKKLCTLLCTSFLLNAGLASAQVGIGTTAPHATAALEISASNKGLLIPRMDSAARTGITDPATGLQVYDTDTNSLWYHDGTTWVDSGATMAGATASASGTAGKVPWPAAGDHVKFLKGDGSWAAIPHAPTAGNGLTAGNGSIGLGGTLTHGTTTVDLQNNSIAFSSSADGGNGHFTVDRSTFAVDALQNSVGIGTVAPNASAALEVSSTSKGLLPPRMSTAQRDAIVSPAAGLTVFNTNTNCLNFYNGISWYSPCSGAINSSSGGTAVISAVVNCNFASTGTLNVGIPATGVTQTIRVNVGNAGTYAISFNTNGVNWTSSGNLTVGTNRTIVLTASGMPLAGGTISNDVPITPGCSFDRTVGCTPVAIATNFSGGLGDTAPFNTKELSANQAGTWSIVSGGGTLSGTTYTAPLLNGKSATVTLQFTAAAPCAASQQFTFAVSSCYAGVSSTEYAAFMCHNLGADTSLDPAVPVKGLHGNYYQWGISAVTADASTPEGAISNWNTDPAADGSWSDTSKTGDDPCPEGYRVPTIAQWEGVQGSNAFSTTGTWTSSAANFGAAVHFGSGASPKRLTLPASGYRNYYDSTLQSRGESGIYWSSTQKDNWARSLFNDYTVEGPRTYGYPVRCIAE